MAHDGEPAGYDADGGYAVALEDGLYLIDKKTAEDYNEQRRRGWRAIRRKDSSDAGTLRVVVRAGETEADYYFSRPVALIADACRVNDDAVSKASSNVLQCYISSENEGKP